MVHITVRSFSLQATIFFDFRPFSRLNATEVTYCWGKPEWNAVWQGMRRLQSRVCE